MPKAAGRRAGTCKIKLWFPIRKQALAAALSQGGLRLSRLLVLQLAPRGDAALPVAQEARPRFEAGLPKERGQRSIKFILTQKVYIEKSLGAK